ncbi:uncharacterized protein OCT59_001565 [Rhizophagus irregularis]|uniref:uncharacterized protein n=1 Tax=Rhizophagus irregularis TaxID=588596 RepID=UPI00332BB49B|nr:hypothetical protein OCT59_001565 [Rhizophagus irregularis]
MPSYSSPGTRQLVYFGYNWLREKYYDQKLHFPQGFRVSDETKKQIALWNDIIQFKHKDDNDEIFCNDPLLIVEYNQPGLAARNLRELDVANVIRGTQNYIPIAFPRVHPPQSNSVIAFNSMQTLDDAVVQLFERYSNFTQGTNHPTIGRIYVVEFRRANTFDVSERRRVFN